MKNLIFLHLLVCLAAIVLFVAFVVVNTMSYNDAVIERDHYCQMVTEGHWPNYKGVDC